MLAALYQNFVVNGFSVEGEQLKRYEAGQNKLAGILGLEADVRLKVRLGAVSRRPSLPGRQTLVGWPASSASRLVSKAEGVVGLDRRSASLVR